jgi:hypothetical protein
MLEATQADLDFTQDAVAPAPAPQDAPGRSETTFAVGEAVYLRGARYGQPGRVLRIERGKLAVLWADLGPSYIGRHRPESLMEAGNRNENAPESPSKSPQFSQGRKLCT